MPNTRNTPWGNWQNEEVEGPPPEAVKPLEEHYTGDVFPYRGTENHGVNPLFSIPVPDDEWEGGSVPVDVDYKEEEPEPQKVIIVRQGRTEILEFRTFHTVANANPTLAISSMLKRQVTKIKNIGTAAIWIGHNESVSALSGYKLDANAEFTTNSTTDIWMISFDGNQQEVCVAIEIAVAIP